MMPFISATKSCIPLMLKKGRMAMVNTMMAKPPTHCVMLRHRRMSLGTASILAKMVAPVVVKPDNASKKPSVKLGTLLLSR